MSKKTLKALAKQMSGIDIAMFSTHTTGGQTATRPMSNNGEVEYDGTSYYFSWENSRIVKDIKKDNKVSLAFQTKKGLYVTVQGTAKLTDDKAKMGEHWTPDLEQWFKDGVDTPGVVMIEVNAKRIHYWDTESKEYSEGEIDL
jgi:general stress protein 26